MTISGDDLFRAFSDGEEGKQAWISGREQSWETSVVRKIIKGLKLGPAAEVSRLAAQMLGSSRLCFQVFQEAFPDLPVRFASLTLPGHKFGDIDNLDEQGFTKCKLYQAYLHEKSLDIDSHKRLMLVFPWTYRTTSVFYSGTPNLREPGTGRFWILKTGIYVVDSLPRVLRILAEEMGEVDDDRLC